MICFIGYGERSRGYRFCHQSYNSKIIEAKKKKMHLFKRMIHIVKVPQDLIFKQDLSFEPTPESSWKLVVIQDNHQELQDYQQPILITLFT